MNFQPNEIIKDKRGENRWKVTGMIQQKRFYTIFQVEDQTPNLERCLYMMTLNYNALPGKNHLFEISDLRHSFHQMAEILCMNYTFLSEPADLLRFTNTQDKMDDSLRADEPALVFAQPQGFPLPRQTRIEKKNTWYKVQSTVRACLKTLSALHRNKVVIRALPLYSIILSHTTFKPYFFGFDTLIRMNAFKGYNPCKVCLEPEALYSAPECFDPRGYLSPATDIYALGKLVLQIILSEYKFKNFFPADDPFPADIQNRINKLKLPLLWSRFLSLSLNPSPDLRFQNTFEVERFFWSKGEPPDRSKRQAKPARPKPFRKDKPAQRTYWKYTTNPQLPPAALVIWNTDLTQRQEQFDFKGFYRKFMYQYSIEPRLFFQFTNKPVDQNHPFFKMLKGTFGLKIISETTQETSEQTRLLFNNLVPESINNLIIVAHSDQHSIQELFKHPKAKEWTINWVRRGNRQAPIPVNNLLDASLFIRSKKYGSKSK